MQGTFSYGSSSTLHSVSQRLLTGKSFKLAQLWGLWACLPSWTKHGPNMDQTWTKQATCGVSHNVCLELRSELSRQTNTLKPRNRIFGICHQIDNFPTFDYNFNQVTLPMLCVSGLLLHFNIKTWGVRQPWGWLLCKEQYEGEPLITYIITDDGDLSQQKHQKHNRWWWPLIVKYTKNIPLEVVLLLWSALTLQKLIMFWQIF